MSNVTPWFRVGFENPSPERPGWYEVCIMDMSVFVTRAYWTGANWRRIGFSLRPSDFYGDLWRGLQEPAK